MGINAISRFVLRHKLAVALFWLVVAGAGFAATGPATSALSERFDLPGRESTEINVAIAERYGNGGFATPLVAVIELPSGTTVDSSGVVAGIAGAFDRIAAAVPHARIVSFASTNDRVFVSADRRTTFGLVYPLFAGEGQSPDAALVMAALADGSIAGSRFHLTGLDELSEGGNEEGGSGVLIETLVGGLGALIVLAWVFGSFLALVPLLIAAIAIVTTYLLVWGMTAITDVSFIVQFLIALIGLGVAIDYSLLIVTRWREERARTAER